MSKATVTRLFIGGVIAAIAGAIVAVAAVWIAIANDVFVMNGPDIVGTRRERSRLVPGRVRRRRRPHDRGRPDRGLVSWIGALLNTWRLESKTWFAVLLLLGIFNLGFFAMIAYLIAGPDGKIGTGPRAAQAPSPA